MTPEEERFERIERNLERMGERLDRMGDRLDQMGDRLDRHIEFVGRSFEEQNQKIEQNTSGIRDLIVVTRTVLTSLDEMRQAHEKDYENLRKAQAATDEKLNILIDTVDRIIRNRNGGS